jgi:hypothetical protein
MATISGRLISALFLLAILTLAGCQNPGRFQGLEEPCVLNKSGPL